MKSSRQNKKGPSVTPGPHRASAAAKRLGEECEGDVAQLASGDPGVADARGCRQHTKHVPGRLGASDRLPHAGHSPGGSAAVR